MESQMRTLKPAQTSLSAQCKMSRLYHVLWPAAFNCSLRSPKPRVQLLLSEIIIEVDAVLPQATHQSWLNGHSEFFHLLKSNGCLLHTKTFVMQQSLSQCEDMPTQVPQLQITLLVASPHFQPSDLLTFTTH